jgi:ATP-independent RNA helicase DbpA
MQLENHQTLNFIVAEPDNILETRYVSCTELDKLKDLFLLLCMVGDRSCIVFCNHRDAVARTANYLSTNGIACVYYHGALEQPERELALAKFRNGSVRTLITTDLAARGLDIPNIRYIIHYHLPHTEESYTHRNGRTARMDKSGTIVLLKGPQETLPTFVGPDAEALELAENPPIPERPQMVTLYLGTGKKDKINKIDIVGFLTNKAQLASDDIGFIEVKDFTAFVAIRRKKVHLVLPRIEQEKIKGRKVKFQIL